ncbi:BTB domain containing protein [Pandoravirus dulcis]|uniref:BTB domain containing protein n=1 Tax=Pandoravirus dulcis TaxID=1349409 RepID=S4VZ09_9VIRU|nr:BTB domain containing protein [Pandoravirus dulcis]AGO83286.1 BTB domain containing protein [Pandoravirus dulcis]
MYTPYADAVRRLRKMRHRMCDCTIELTPSNKGGDDGVAREPITAHRAVLARWPYFKALFARADPARVDVGTGDARGTFRVVYAAAIPFAASSVCTLVDMAYDDAKIALIKDPAACDPVDVINCALYLGVRTRHVHALVAHAVEALLDCLPPTPDGARPESADVGAFVLHMLAGDLGEPVKRGLVARLYYLMPDADRAAAVDAHGDRLPSLPLCYAMSAALPLGLRVCCDRIDTTFRRKKHVVSDALTTLTVDFSRDDVVCMDGMNEMDVVLHVVSTAAAFWHCRVRFLHPIEPCNEWTLVLCAGALTARSTVSDMYRSTLTVCEVDLWPVP